MRDFGGNWNKTERKKRYDDDIVIPQFNFKSTVTFQEELSSYSIFQGLASDLEPAPNVHLLELTSTLFTDYSSKQRLIKLPAGEQLEVINGDKFSFPDRTILAKTFYYPEDKRQPKLGKRIIETRLLIKEDGLWNAATYVWNKEQTEAFLNETGMDTDVRWIEQNGDQMQTTYHIPSKNECATCHQSNSAITPIGPRIRNLNRDVMRSGSRINQLDYLESLEILAALSDEHKVAHIADYMDPSISLSKRSRAYLDMNCAHCHNPDGWQLSRGRKFDFRNETPLPQTGILSNVEKIERNLENRKMPLIGTSMLDKEGVKMITDYLKTLN